MKYTGAKVRREGGLAPPWFFLISAVFFMDSPENWTEAVRKLLPELEADSSQSARVFLAGSPIFFPSFKLLWLMEEAGLTVVADDMCSGERLLPGGVNYSDSSEFGLMTALAQLDQAGSFQANSRRGLNMNLNIGLDLGSTAIKMALVEGECPIWLPTSPPRRVRKRWPGAWSTKLWPLLRLIKPG